MSPHLTLPGETDAPPPTAGRLAGLVAGALALALGLNAALIPLIGAWNRDHDTRKQVVAGKWRQLGTGPIPGLLITGDSSGLHGADPSVFAERLGQPCYNACAFGSLGLANEAWLIQHLCNAGRLPRSVLSIHVLDVWPRDAGPLRSRLSDFPEELAPWRCWPPLVAPPAPDRLGHLFPLVSSPAQARLALDRAVNPWRTGPSLRLDGFLPLDEPDPANVRRDLARIRQRLAKRQVRISDINREAFLAIIATIDRAGSRFTLAEAPVPTELAGDPRYIQALDGLESELAGLAAGRAGFSILRTGRAGYPMQSMQDAEHLATPEVRHRYSAELVEMLIRPR